MRRHFKQSPQSVEDQFNVLVRCSGKDEENNALESITYVQRENIYYLYIMITHIAEINS